MVLFRYASRYMTPNEELMNVAKVNLAFWQSQTENAIRRMEHCKNMRKEWSIEIQKLEEKPDTEEEQ